MVMMMMININVTAGDNDNDDDMVNCILVRQFRQLLTMSLMLQYDSVKFIDALNSIEARIQSKRIFN